MFNFHSKHSDYKRLLHKIAAAGLLLVILCALVPSPLEAAQTGAEKDRLYLLLIDKLSIYDLDENTTPALCSIIDQGAIGLASTRTLKSNNTLNNSLTVGAGNLARFYGGGVKGFNASETIREEEKPAATLYKNVTGIDPGNSSCLLVNLPEILAGLSTESVTTVPGAMGETLRSNGYQVCLLGNADTSQRMMRPGIAVAMDARGQVPLGDVGEETCQPSLESIISRQTNYEYLQNMTAALKNQVDVFVIELSDLARLETAPAAQPEIEQQNRLERLAQIDQFVGRLVNTLDPSHDVLFITGLSSSKDEISIKNNFVPVIAYGNQITPGYITSPATHRDYILANTDVAPTILDYFGLQVDHQIMIGQPVEIMPAEGKDTLQEAAALTDSASRANRLRYPLIRGYVFALIIIILLTLLVVLWFPRFRHLFQIMVVGIVSVPLVFLLLGVLNLGADWRYIGVAILAVIIITWIALLLFKNPFNSFVALSICTILLINVDILTGTHLIQTSVLGYDPMAGARYYGIGNEYMGILLGSSIIVSAALYERCQLKRYVIAIALFLMLQCVLIASPQLGANSDGLITAPLAFLVTLLLFSNIRINPTALLGIAGVVAVAVVGVAYFDMLRAPEIQSHIGRAASQIVNGGWGEAITIITRKLSMNLKLIRYTIWSWVFIVILLALALSVYFPVGAMRFIRRERPCILKGFVGIVTAALVGLVVNDSGIVAASTTSIYLVVPLLLMMLEHVEKVYTKGQNKT